MPGASSLAGTSLIGTSGVSISSMSPMVGSGGAMTTLTLIGLLLLLRLATVSSFLSFLLLFDYSLVGLFLIVGGYYSELPQLARNDLGRRN